MLSVLDRADAQLKRLSPFYFALVMATGIVSIAAELLGMGDLGAALLVLNAGVYLVLWLLTVLRLVRYRGEFLSDLTDHQRGLGFLTLVAGTCVLGGQTILIGDRFELAAVLLGLGTNRSGFTRTSSLSRFRYGAACSTSGSFR